MKWRIAHGISRIDAVFSRNSVASVRSLLAGLTLLLGSSSSMAYELRDEVEGDFDERVRTRGFSDLQQESVFGTVEDITTDEVCMGVEKVLQVKLRSGKDSFFVDLGPLRYVDLRSLDLLLNGFALGDEVVASGVVLRDDGTPLIVARQIEKAGRVVQVRDRGGHPLALRPRMTARGVDYQRLSH